MPLAAPNGSGLGIRNPYNIRIILELLEGKVLVIVDAGVGTACWTRPSRSMLGCDGVLMNTAIAGARDLMAMAEAMRDAVVAGRKAFRAGRIPRQAARRRRRPRAASSNSARAVPRLYFITDRHATAGRALNGRRAAPRSRRASADVAVQLRDKEFLDGRALDRPRPRAARGLTRPRAPPSTSMTARRRRVGGLGADGVHLGGRSLSPADVARVAPALAVAVSTHTRAEGRGRRPLPERPLLRRLRSRLGHALEATLRSPLSESTP